MALKETIDEVEPVVTDYNSSHSVTPTEFVWQYDIRLSLEFGFLYKGLTRRAAFDAASHANYLNTFWAAGGQGKRQTILQESYTPLAPAGAITPPDYDIEVFSFLRTSSINSILPNENNPCAYNLSISTVTEINVQYRGWNSTMIGGDDPPKQTPVLTPAPDLGISDPVYPKNITITQSPFYETVNTNVSTKYFVWDLYGRLGNTQGFPLPSGSEFNNQLSQTIQITKPSIIIAYSYALNRWSNSAPVVGIYND